MARSRELPQGIIDATGDGDFMMAVRAMDFAETEQQVADIADKIADAREKHGLSVDETGVAVRIAQVALSESEPTGA